MPFVCVHWQERLSELRAAEARRAAQERVLSQRDSDIREQLHKLEAARAELIHEHDVLQRREAGHTAAVAVRSVSIFENDT